MNETDKYILDSIKSWVWSGFYSPAEVDEMIGDILEDDTDETFLRAAVEPEFEKKAQAEKKWPQKTDGDRLDAAFKLLEARGVLTLHNAGYTMSDGHSDAAEALEEQGSDNFTGYCFYHGQDLERAVRGEGLMIAFDSIKDDVEAKKAVGNLVINVLESAGFVVEWNGDTETRIRIPKLDWKRRYRPG